MFSCACYMMLNKVRKVGRKCLINVVCYLFIFMVCSREFTHRVKSVSMSKFTSQEVEALQKGGNQV